MEDNAKMNPKYPRTVYNGPGDEIVISGISGSFPKARNIKELEYNLYNKIDMLDDSEIRWRHENPDIPRRTGKIFDIEKFDATFFGIHFKQANAMDPQGRILIEKAYEAIMDAGINPKLMKGTKTGVYIAACFNESEKVWLYDGVADNEFGIVGNSRAMLANRVSYVLGLRGPSMLIDTACSSSLFAIDAAFTAMRNGECDAALIGGASLVLCQCLTFQFTRLGMLAPDGMCRSFDIGGNGYVRSDAVSIIFLQKSRDAKRIYGTVAHSKTNCDGYKEEGITYPSGHMQAKLLTEFYTEINIKPETVDYIEAHGTGTIVGDPEECLALDQVFCKNRKTPMPIGSVKSNLGHSEGAAGLNSVAKCIIAMENQLIPPNINFTKIRPNITALIENRLQVVQNAQKLDGPLIAINSFGFGGANAHCLLRANPKNKLNNGAPEDSISRLVNWSGRTEEACNVIHEALTSRPLDTEYIALLQSTQSESVSGNVFKSYGLYKHVAGTNAQCLTKEIEYFSGTQRPIIYVFSGMGSQWNEMGTNLLELPLFRQTIQKCHDVLKPKGLDLLDIITSTEKTMFENILHSFVGIAAIQAALCDCLTAINIQPDYIIGHSVGELGCGYADKCLTVEEMVLCAYSRGVSSLETKTIRGAMAAVGQSYNQIKNLVPPTIDVACHNGPDSCTISGPENEIKKFVAELTANGIFARAVAVSNIAYHSRYIAEMGPKLYNNLTKIIKEPKKRSAKWLSTSVPQSKWGLPESQYCSAEYQTNNLLSPVLFEETSLLLPQNAILIEIAPHGLLQAVLRKSFTKAISIPLTQRGNKHNLDFFLTALGRIYLNGVDMAIENLYPKIEFPVSRGTPSISPLIKWDHSTDWFVMKNDELKKKTGTKLFTISLDDENYKYIAGHMIDGRCLFPATGYLKLVWDTYAIVQGTKLFSHINIEFTEVKFLRATTLTTGTSVDLLVVIQLGSGRFEITDGDVIVVTGYMIDLHDDVKFIKIPSFVRNGQQYLQTKDFYKELRLRGYNYAGLFRNVIEARSDGLHGKLRWNSDWISFMDCLLQISILGMDTRSLLVPTMIDKITIDATRHWEALKQFDLDKPENNFFEVLGNKTLNSYQAGGVQIQGLHASSIVRRRILSLPVLESYKFVSYWPTPRMSDINAARICVQHVLENHPTRNVKCVELLKKGEIPFITKLECAIEDLPLISGDLTILTADKIEQENIQVKNGTLSEDSSNLFIIRSNLLAESELIESSKLSLLPHGYILTREAYNLKQYEICVPQGFNLIAMIPLDNETLVLLQKKFQEFPEAPTSIKISLHDKEFKWLEQIKSVDKNETVIAYSQNEPLSGIIGLVNCIRKEPNRSNVICVFIDDPKAPPFDITNSFYKNQLKLNLAINVYQNGKWGTYRHLTFNKLTQNGPFDGHAFANLTVRGDLSSLRWLNGPFSKQFADQQIKIHFAALNFRDVMLATGKIGVEVFGESRLDQECVLGLEYSGIDCNGNRIMGMTNSGAISTHIIPDQGLLWRCPKNWSLEEAATIPVVYGTVYAALFLHANIKKGKSILIHAGTGGVGLAAIRVAFAYGLDVFTTVSTMEKRKFLLNLFPQLKDSHIGNSRDLSFEAMIQTETNGTGVDYVLNSLAEEKLQASVRCLGKGGKFLEIGKFDMANNNKIGLRDFLKEISFQAVLLDNLFKAPLNEKKELHKLLQRDIDAGIIKPLPTTVYQASEIETAFRFLASGKHMGKVLLKIRENSCGKLSLPIEVYPRFNCEANASYVIIGGLGGFGLELVDWLIIRGAHNIVISSSQGISKQYQEYRIKIWQSYGATININTSNIGTENGCETILKEANKLEPVAGIFNLAVLLQDGILENQTVEKFTQCLKPKANATIYMDKLSRKLCPNLKHFVVFSSISCGRGNAGQTNYGMANSIMERVVEQRLLCNLPGKAIQWGAVDEVGLVADMAEGKQDALEIGGTLPQRISSCFEELDYLLLANDPVVASMVVAEKRVNAGGKKDIILSLMNIMSIRDVKSVSMNATLAEIGMDSLMAVEIHQTLERDYDIVLSAQDLRIITLSQLHELYEQKKTAKSTEGSSLTPETSSGIQMIQTLGDGADYEKSIIRLQTCNNSTNFKTALFILPGIEGVLPSQFKTIISSINLPTFSVQLTNISHAKTVSEIVEAVFLNIQKEFGKILNKFYIVGYSFGCLIALMLAKKFEVSGITGNVVLLDGSLPFSKQVALSQVTDTSDNGIEFAACAGILKKLSSEFNSNDYLEKLFALHTSWDDRANSMVQLLNAQNTYSNDFVQHFVHGVKNRFKIVLNTKNSEIPPIKAPITLIRPTEALIQDFDDHYELDKFTESGVSLKFIEGNHSTMLVSTKLVTLLDHLQPNSE